MSIRTSDPKKRRSGRLVGQRRFVLGVTIPTILYAGGLSLLPIVWAFALMFFKYSPQRAGGAILGLGGNNPFVGLEHFRAMIEGVAHV